MLKIVGLGPGSKDGIPSANLEALRNARRVILRTARHPSAEVLRGEGIAFETCDDLYESSQTFDELYAAIAERVISAGEGAVYGVPGHPLCGEESVRILLARCEAEVLPAPSFIEVTLAALRKPFSGALQVWNAHEPMAHWPDARANQMVYQVDSRQAANDAKLRLLQYFDAESRAYLVSDAGIATEKVLEIELSEVDKHEVGPMTTLYVEGLSLERPKGFYGLVDIVDRLLGPGGCPWDREQTHETLKRHAVEETYEVLAAIDSGDPDRLCEELGDLLLQSVMHAQMDAIEGLYDVDDVIARVSEKLVTRHPHVFGEGDARTADEVLQNWDAIKQREKGEPASILDGVPAALPSLLRAFEVSKRAARVGFEWPSVEEVWRKVEEERAELKEAISGGDASRIEEEFGDLLFALVNVARWLAVEPEDALRRMVDRFVDRFQAMERVAQKPLRELSAEEWDALWESAKSER